MITDFVPVVGPPLKVEDGRLRFQGGKIQDPQGGAERAKVGLYLTKEVFAGGNISAKFIFTNAAVACAAVVAFFDT